MGLESNDRMDDGLATLIPPPPEDVGDVGDEAMTPSQLFAMGQMVATVASPRAEAVNVAAAPQFAVGTLIPDAPAPAAQPISAKATIDLDAPPPLATGTLIPDRPRASMTAARQQRIAREQYAEFRTRDRVQAPGKSTRVELEAAPMAELDPNSAAGILRNQLVAAMEAHRDLATLLATIDPETLAATLRELGASEHPELLAEIIALAGQTLQRFQFQ